MCGIAGIYNYKNKARKKDINNMMEVIKHRGPDGSGMYIENHYGVGHRLLKIQDVSDNSRQPYEYKNLVLAFNGEVYNYEEIKKELMEKGYEFNTVGDTEVLIKMLDCYGLDETLKKIDGCYAISIYNKDTEELCLVRDRFGIKPLYYYKDDDRVVFCSEIKGILECDNIPRKFNLDKVLETLNCRLWLSSETTLFEGIYAIKPGTYLTINKDGVKQTEYYSLKFDYKYNNPDDVIKDFGKAFEESVRKKLISKVPVGAFLSGGLDSSIVCKLLKDYSKETLSTYTICYDFDNDLDKNHAAIIANNEGFNNHNITITEDMYNIENIDVVTYGVEEILIDKVYIPMYFNYKAAKKDGYTVVISGQGSDEAWLGYIFIWKIFTYLNDKYDKDIIINDCYINNMMFKGKINKKYDKELYRVMSKYLDQNWVFDKSDEMNSFGDLSLKTILHDLLIQEDKIAMMSSVESRVPFVDSHKIVEIAYNTPSKLKLFDGREKYIVRKYSEGKIDDSIVKREKYPFPEPPKIYNRKVTSLCKANWDEMRKSKILNLIIDEEKFKNIDNFTEQEQWWMLIYWRFEKVFNMEV